MAPLAAASCVAVILAAFAFSGSTNTFSGSASKQQPLLQEQQDDVHVEQRRLLLAGRGSVGLLHKCCLPQQA